MSLRPLKYRKVAKRLKELGFCPVSQRGLHVKFKDEKNRMTIVINHPGEVISKGLLKKIIKDAELTVEEFMQGIN